LEFEIVSAPKQTTSDHDPLKQSKDLPTEKDEKNNVEEKEPFIRKEYTEFVKKDSVLQVKTTALTELKVEDSKRIKLISSPASDTILSEFALPPKLIEAMESHLHNTKKYWANASFSQTCLESRLDRRNTNYSLDDEDNVKILLGVSGAGKTRQLLELLYMNHGYYFVTIKRHLFGSEDLASCQKLCEQSPKLCDYYIKVLYFIRAFVCNYLINNGFKEPSQILLAQLHPDTFFGTDIFNSLFLFYAGEFFNISLQPSIPYFDFVVIDEIQQIVESPFVFEMLPRRWPFLSPLVLHSKNLRDAFPKFIISGTGINFEFITEVLSADTFKKSNIHFRVISNLEPLDKSQVAEYSRLVLQDNGLESDLIGQFVESVTLLDLCHGRARFIAFILDSFLKTKNIEHALNTFKTELRNVHGALFPLKFYRRDLIQSPKSYLGLTFCRHWKQQILDGMLQFINTGKAVLNIYGQDASDGVRMGLGFCKVNNNAISSVEMVEPGVIYCLRFFIPFSTLAQEMVRQFKSYYPPEMAQCTLERLVGYALVSNINPHHKENMRVSTRENEISYLTEGSENELFFPEYCCGPDILYRSGRSVHIVQVKFVDTFSKQKHMRAIETTDPEFFYWNWKKCGPLKGFEDKRLELIELLKTFEVKRYVFVNVDTKAMAGMDTDIISKTTQPEFFNQIHPGVWQVLDWLRKEFKTCTYNL
jgi:hypothetical protein